MGKAATLPKSRSCPLCQRKLYTTALQLKEHISECKRLLKLGFYRG